MQTVLLVIHLIIAIALVATVLLQQSEGGALGIGGGPGGLVTARGAANLLTRATAILATIFFITSLVLTIMANQDSRARTGSVVDVPAATKPNTPQSPEVPLSQ